VLFDCVTRCSYLAVEKQTDFQQKLLPTVLRLLLAHSRGEAIEPGAVEQLRASDLLTDNTSSPKYGTFLSRFQQSVFNYPFFDYSTPKTFQTDRDLMAAYEEEEASPPPWTRRDGRSVALPPVDWANLTTPAEKQFAANGSAALDLPRLAAILRFTFGPISVLPSLGKRLHYRRTSPSGGAKHPTECWIIISEPWEGLSPGTYVYDCANHTLVLVDPALATPGCVTMSPLAFSIRSRVERPMWRYRDGRSFRAVLLDAGHIIETLATLLGDLGIAISTHPAGRPAGGFAWLREPEVAFIALASSTSTAEVSKHLPSQELVAASGSMVTNPAMYFTVEQGCFRAHIVHPEVSSFLIDDRDFAILTHCILSHRGSAHRPNDRRTDVGGVLESVPGSTYERVGVLLEQSALMDATSGLSFYSELRRWSEHGWYQPALTWLEALNSPTLAATKPTQVRLSTIACDVPAALRERVTTRAFASDPIEVATLVDLLRGSFVTDTTTPVSAYVAALKVTGLQADSLHRWDGDKRILSPCDQFVSAAELVELTIGQQWLKSSAAAIWLVAHLLLEEPSTYASAHIQLGRMAQRIAILATARKLGVFQTPAIEDNKLIARTGMPQNSSMSAYLVCIGTKRVP
jgi:hypothetical protein